MKKLKELPITWGFLDEFRGRDFSGEWPTIPEMFNISVKRYPDRNAFTAFEPNRVTLTYSQAMERVTALANWLYEQGIRKGDHVGLTGKNSPEWAITFLAIGWIGAVVIPIDYALSNSEQETLFHTAQPKLIFVDEEKYDYYLQAAKTNPDIKSVYSLSKKYEETYVYNLKASSTHEFDKAGEDDLAAILFTSGTTGIPKGAMLTHKNIISDAFIATKNMHLYHTDVFYAILPIHHAYTLTAVFIETITWGAEVVFGKSLAVSKLLKELNDGKVTMLLGVPLLFNKLLAGIQNGIREKGPIVNGVMKTLMGLSYFVKLVFKVNIGKTLFKPVLKKAGLANIRIAICGAGPLAPSVFKAYNEMGIDFVQGYGLTESSPILALNPVEHFKIESIGRDFYPHMDTKIINPDEHGIGELCFKGPMIMKGYYQLPEETAATFTEDGYLKTGDLGWMDEERYIYLSGRAKNMIVTSGGKNVYPEEIENAFQLFYNDIEQITVKAYQGLEGEEPEALVYVADDFYSRNKLTRGNAGDDEKALAKVEEIIGSVNKKLLPYQRITKITILKEPLEMTTTKKVKRHFANT